MITDRNQRLVRRGAAKPIFKPLTAGISKNLSLTLTFLVTALLLPSTRSASAADGAQLFRISGPAATKITTVKPDGTVIWSNAQAVATYTFQMATALSPEGTNWVDYVRVVTSKNVNTNRLIDPKPPAGFAWIPAGTFVMGSGTDEAQRGDDEVQHTVTLTKGFYMSKHEVTQEEFLAVVGGDNPSCFTDSNCESGETIDPDLNRPVESVTWSDATNYCGLLTQQDRAAGKIPSTWRYRLPTEAEWEFACRAGTTNAFSFGDVIQGGLANYNSEWEYDAAGGDYLADPLIFPPLSWTTTISWTTNEGSYMPNTFGLYNVHGNVLEWCQDWYGNYPVGSVVDPTGPATGTERVIRGGSWSDLGSLCRSAVRYSILPDSGGSYLGFRVVLFPG